VLEAFLECEQQLLFECGGLSGALVFHVLVDLCVQLALGDVLGLAPHDELEALLEELGGVLTCQALQVVRQGRVVQQLRGERV
jgi:hypothetical protein